MSSEPPCKRRRITTAIASSGLPSLPRDLWCNISSFLCLSSHFALGNVSKAFTVVSTLPPSFAPELIIYLADGITPPIAQVRWLNWLASVAIGCALHVEAPEPSQIRGPPRPRENDIAQRSFLTSQLSGVFCSNVPSYDVYSALLNQGTRLQMLSTVNHIENGEAHARILPTAATLLRLLATAPRQQLKRLECTSNQLDGITQLPSIDALIVWFVDSHVHLDFKCQWPRMPKRVQLVLADGHPVPLDWLQRNSLIERVRRVESRGRRTYRLTDFGRLTQLQQLHARLHPVCSAHDWTALKGLVRLQSLDLSHVATLSLPRPFIECCPKTVVDLTLSEYLLTTDALKAILTGLPAVKALTLQDRRMDDTDKTMESQTRLMSLFPRVSIVWDGSVL